MGDFKALGAVLGTVAALPSGSITVATLTSPAAGILGVLGLTTTTTVTLPVTGVVAVSGLIGYGLYKGMQAAQGNN